MTPLLLVFSVYLTSSLRWHVFLRTWSMALFVFKFLCNDELYDITNQTQLSKNICIQHVAFLCTYCKIIWKSTCKSCSLRSNMTRKMTIGPTVEHFRSTINKQLKELYIQDFHQAKILAQDRDNCRNFITRASFQKKTWLDDNVMICIWSTTNFQYLTYYMTIHTHYIGF